MANDYYSTLGVPKSATESEIKKAYRKLAKQYHPDLNKNDKSAESKLKEINEAYEVLSDKTKRSRYDQLGHAGFNQNFGGSSSAKYSAGFEQEFDLGDIFGSFFSGGFDSSSYTRSRPQRGTDIEVSVSVSFSESATGCTKTINYNRVAACETCSGTGAKNNDSKKTCSRCRGSGQVVESQRTPFGVIQTSHTCEVCAGAGQVIEHPCSACGGRGKVRKSESLEIEIPAGIDNEQILNVRNKGNAGSNSSSFGDLHIYISVKPHPIFSRKNDDIWCEIPIPFVQASLGGDVTVPTLTGKVQYHVHEGTQHGDIFKLKGKGMPKLSGRGHGDQMIKISIEIPRNLTEEQKELLKKFDKISVAKNYQKNTTFFDRIKQIFGS
ncbi:MAG: molecular chaperone DnaJ [Oscillospiraceae bacterium]|jgi:molecular chaperone DnaJ|nr:molecular chaperone DnaJ [Oscillospiraceae bacterium]